MRPAILLACVPLVLFVALGQARAQEPRTLDIYFLDMAGGGSTLIVTPAHESVLIDTGSLRPEHRDADRILRACKDAGLTQIDYLVTTHFHSDHFGAILEVSQRIPVKCFMDKGTRAPAEDGDNRWSKELYSLYDQATGGKVKVLRPGDSIPLANLASGGYPFPRLTCLAADKKFFGAEIDVDAPVEGFKMERPDNSDNARSIALLLTYGPFKFFAGGDITRNVEFHLVHPNNTIGKVDLYQVTHHGLDLSNHEILLKALAPTVAVAMNGTRKGIMPRTFRALTALPSLKALYQIRYNTEYGDAGNTRPEFIANPKDNPDKGEYIKASINHRTGAFTLQLGPTGERRTYQMNGPVPELKRATRLEIKYLPSTLALLQDGYFAQFKMRDLVSAEEIGQLKSLDVLAVNDPELIKALAKSIALAPHMGTGIVRMPEFVSITCYEGDKRLTSFTMRGSRLYTQDSDAFDCQRHAPNLQELTPQLRPFRVRAGCAMNLAMLQRGLQLHVETAKSLPEPPQWCDALVPIWQAKQAKWDRLYSWENFKCPNVGEGRCTYAMNARCKTDSPPDAVLLFETAPGWNQHGGPELFAINNHDPKGGCMLLKDGTIKFIRTKQELQQLRWE